MGNLIAVRLTRVNGAPKHFESFEEKRANKIGLQPAGLCLLHLFFYGKQPLLGHGLLRQGIPLDERLDMIPVEFDVKLLAQLGPDIRAVAEAKEAPR